MGYFPNCLLMADRFDICEKQARGLFHHSIADAFFRQVPGIDYREALRAMQMDINYAGNEDFRTQGLTSYPVHTLDLNCACHAGEQVARAIGEPRLAADFAVHVSNWKNVMAEDGLLPASIDYYEGSNRNYSFRILPDMQARMALFPSRQDFVAALDDYFGFGAQPVGQAGYTCEPAGEEQMRWGCSLARFEGINNEPDMDAPYNYAWAGRHDRICEIVRSAMVSVFGLDGAGALPGNDDSGALTSWFVWNALGIFPITGRDLFMIGSPTVRRACLKLAAGIFAISTAGCGIYVQRAFLNDTEIFRSYLAVCEVMQGGRLHLVMGEQPSDFGTRDLPD
ncbi:MAG TPA: hypothetical protein DD640_07325 [Clostridiales bacterium]|nr:hypothetical protein [Clostridiales bacterium]